VQRICNCKLFSRVVKNTVTVPTLAVSLFGDWRANRNRRYVDEQHLDVVYVNKPFAAIADEEITYSVPFFVAEIQCLLMYICEWCSCWSATGDVIAGLYFL